MGLEYTKNIFNSVRERASSGSRRTWTHDPLDVNNRSSYNNGSV